jgi:RimJ/RimL family protein N-acetyltransferase
MRFVIAAARTTPETAALELSVTSDAPVARRLYERLGFVCWGVEAAAMRIDGRLIDEAHYVLRFDASDPD